MAGLLSLMKVFRRHKMQDEKEAIQNKIKIAQEAAAKLVAERDELLVKIAPLNQRIEKLAPDISYWTRRIDKLTKQLSDIGR